MIFKLLLSFVLLLGLAGCNTFKNTNYLGVWVLESTAGFKLDTSKNIKSQLRALNVNAPTRILFTNKNAIFELKKTKVREKATYESVDGGFILHTTYDNVYTPFSYIDDKHISVYWNNKYYKYINGIYAKWELLHYLVYF